MPSHEADTQNDTTSDDLAPTSGSRFYLIVFEGESSRMFVLPEAGEAVIGRGDDAAVHLADAGASRAHARVDVVAGEPRLTDLGSQNGTFLNGEALAGARPLVSGDTIGIGNATLVFHSGSRRATRRRPLEFTQFRQRVDEELERVVRYERRLTLAAVVLGLGVADRPRVANAIDGAIRVIDAVTWGGADQLLFLLPELDVNDVRDCLGRLLGVVSRVAPDARAGFAMGPADGCDFDTLVASARAAASAAPPCGIAAAAETFATMTIAGRKVVVADPAMTRLYALLRRIAVSDLTVLVGGETGTGKELVASAVHEWSPRGAEGRPFVSVNCAAIPETLVESELFGHERGAFSGAVATKLGLLESASGGTVFLDEIGEVSLGTQAKLLRVLETHRLTRIGDVREREVDVRVVVATNRDLEADVRAGRFRQDLYFRLNGAAVWLPPLRDRRRELPILAQVLLDEACLRAGSDRRTFAHAAMQELLTYEWPGNVRELKNVVDYVAAAHTEPVVEAWHVLDRMGGGRGSSATLAAATPATALPDGSPIAAFRPLSEEIRELEIRRITDALEASGGNQTSAAALIRMPLRTFVGKVKQYEIRVEGRRASRSGR